MIQRGFLFTPETCVRSFSLIHVEDLVNAALTAGEDTNTPSGEVFFISRPEAYVWEDVGREIARALGKHYRRVSFPKWMVKSAGLAGDAWSWVTARPATINSQKVKELFQSSWLCDPSKARARLGFNPSIDLESGIRETVRWYQERGWL
jgi:nucleoside-diphosphate-sugar epimerase